MLTNKLLIASETPLRLIGIGFQEFEGEAEGPEDAPGAEPTEPPEFSIAKYGFIPAASYCFRIASGDEYLL